MDTDNSWIGLESDKDHQPVSILIVKLVFCHIGHFFVLSSCLYLMVLQGHLYTSIVMRLVVFVVNRLFSSIFNNICILC